MGIPAAFRWLSRKYPKIISNVKEEEPKTINGETFPVDTTKPNPNGEEFDNLYLDMNGIVHPCSHPEDRPAPATEADMMLEIFKYTDRLLNMVRPRKLLMIAIDGVAPRAKMNQQRQRRFRSAQEAKEKDAEAAAFARNFATKNGAPMSDTLQAHLEKKTWDSNAITPGTPFMDTLARCLRYWIAYKLNTDPMWANIKTIISDASVPGEGEHKIMNFIRSQRSSSEHDPNTSHVLYGLDADLIMLGLATHEPHFRILREDVFFDEKTPKGCKICGQFGHRMEDCTGAAKKKEGEFDEKSNTPAKKPFIWLHVSILREYLAVEMSVPNQGFNFDLERALDDWVFMCFFVGNDFLPHLPSLEIRDQGIDTLTAIWRDKLPIMGGYVTKDGHVDLERAQIILSGLADLEDDIFKRRRQAQLDDQAANARRNETQAKRRATNNNFKSRNAAPDASSVETVNLTSLRDPNLGFGRRDVPAANTKLTHEMITRGADYQASQANKSAAAVLKERLKAGSSTEAKPKENTQQESSETNVAGTDTATATSLSTPKKRKADDITPDDTVTPNGQETPNTEERPPKPNDPREDTVKLWEEGYRERYYEQKFHVAPDDLEFRAKVAKSYVEGLSWVLLYYFQGCPSWTWYYPYHYAPFAADFVKMKDMKITFDKGKPFRPYEQLMGVMPAASNHTIPKPFRSLMTDENSPIIDFYPEKFELDMNGKKRAWQGVVLLPFIDEKLLLQTMNTRYPELTEDEVKRNELGRDVLIFHESHGLNDVVMSHFYSKKQGVPKLNITPKISDGLSGKVEKDDEFYPQSSLDFPIPNGGMPDLDQNAAVSVFYDHPPANQIHKSMLLRGVTLPKRSLNSNNISKVQHFARQNQRTYGGAPLDNRQNHNGSNGYNNKDAGSQRPNPFAAHLFPPVPPNFNGFPPPPPGFNPGGFAGGQATNMQFPQMPFPPMPFPNQSNHSPPQGFPPMMIPPYGNGPAGFGMSGQPNGNGHWPNSQGNGRGGYGSNQQQGNGR